ncbi:MAG: ABC transporter substrate-binding protein [Candidatus Promineifilaceae bacterium]|nr:ABC transporter substrate-binding protein [Candidatus Promineifilaceae bacterium]
MINRKWPLFAAKIILVTSVVTACRTQPEGSETAVVITRTESDGTEGESEDEPPSATPVEVTRVVVETQVVPATVTPSPEPQRELVICLSNEPNSLYPYARERYERGSGFEATRHVLNGLYEPLVTNLSFAFQPLGLVKLPNPDDGDVVVEPVPVSEGMTVLDVNNDVVELRPGVLLFDSEGEEIIFHGQPVTMTQMTVRFTLQPLVWSDGRPVTADDSVYGFELAADPQTPTPKVDIERTASYQAIDTRTVEWRSVPGWVDRTYQDNVWMPYPRHYWGTLSPAALVTAERATTQPLSHGPFVMRTWVKGDHLVLEPNDYYYRADQGLPRLDRIRFNFVDSSAQLLAQLLSGQCDVGTHDGLSLRDVPALLDAEARGLLAPRFQISPVFEHVDFGINPVDGYAVIRPDWFERAEVRRALVQCTDRQRMVDELLFGQSEVMHAYIPDMHPLFPAEMPLWTYDVDAANARLDEVGYLDEDEDGVREDRFREMPFAVTLYIAAENDLHEPLAAILAENLAECGIAVSVEALPGERYFDDGPRGPLFGRQFDLAAFPWLIGSEPNCSLYRGDRIPGPDNGWNRNYNNASGFRSEAFDAACEAALAALPGTDAYAAAHREALRIFAEEMPILPLFSRLQVAATRPGVQHFQLDPTEPSELWNLAELDLAP